LIRSALPLRLSAGWTPSSAASGHDVPDQKGDGDDGRRDSDDGDGGGGDNHSPPIISLLLPVQTLSSERHSPRSGEGLREAGENGEVGVKLDLRQSTNAERCQAVRPRWLCRQSPGDSGGRQRIDAIRHGCAKTRPLAGRQAKATVAVVICGNRDAAVAMLLSPDCLACFRTAMRAGHSPLSPLPQCRRASAKTDRGPSTPASRTRTPRRSCRRRESR
jgi:hypothetical protein